MIETDPIPDNVRLNRDLPSYPLEAGTILCVEGRDEATGQLIVSRSATGSEFIVDWGWVEPVTLVNARDLHVITERADGPDLDDLVRLIRYLRGHRVQHSLRDAHTWEDDDLFDPARLTVAFGKAAITDGAPLPDLYGLVAYFVGPDGTVYDCNGEAL